MNKSKLGIGGWLCLCALGAAGGMGASSVRAAAVDDFEASPAMTLHQAQERGCAYAVEAAPAGGEGKAAKVTWNETHGGFFELYYAKDIALGGADAGKLRVKVYCEKAGAVTGVAARIKNAAGEIFHFQTNVQVPAAEWREIEVDVRQGQQKGSWGGDRSGKLVGPLKLTGYGVFVNKSAPAGAAWLDSVAWEPAAATGNAAPATKPAAPNTQAAAPANNASIAELVGRYNIESANLLQPFWVSQRIKGESVLFVQEQDGEPATGTLLFSPVTIERLVAAREGTVYEVNRDFTVDAAARKLMLTRDSRIPFMKRAEFYKQKGEKQAIREKAGDPNTWLLYAEQFFQGKQVEVDYTTRESWAGYRPEVAEAPLKTVIAKLKAREPLTIVLLGDSITAGANSSSKGYAPHMPPYGVLVAAELEKLYGSKVTLVRLGVGGATTDGGIRKIPEVVAAKPDLVIVAFGMNDVAGRNPTAYARNTRAIIQGIHADAPQTSIILVASSCANPEWSWSPWEQFPKYRDALAELAGGNIVLADMSTLWRQILERKRYYDLTGNGINHPNDYGHRLMAQVILGLLVPPHRDH